MAPLTPWDSNGQLDFRDVVNQHWSAVFRFLRTLGGDEHLAEDLTQETFLRALDRISTFAAGTNMRAWLFRIANNIYFDEHRKKKRSHVTQLDYEPSSKSVPPGTQLELQEQATEALEALKELTELTRLVFHLRVYEELSFREIADLAGTTEQSARWHMHHAREKIMARMRSLGGDHS